MSDTVSNARVIRLLGRCQSGDGTAEEELFPAIYAELRDLARRYLRRERSGHTLQPTALVNEAYLRMLGSDARADDRRHFIGLAARTMRQVLVDHARRKRAGKRFDPEQRVTLATGVAPADQPPIDVLALDEALTRLAEAAPRAARLVELRYFGGLTREEVAEVLGVSVPSVERDWRAARAWLRTALAG